MGYSVFDAELPFYGALPLYVIFFLLSVTCKLGFFLGFGYHYGQTLSSVPGPRWASWSRLWIVRAIASKRSAEVFVEVNQLYGKLYPDDFDEDSNRSC